MLCLIIIQNTISEQLFCVNTYSLPVQLPFQYGTAKMIGRARADNCQPNLNAILYHQQISHQMILMA